MGSDTSIFGSISSLAGLKPETLRYLLEQSRTAVVEPGEYFFRQGDLGRSVFVIESGKVEVTKEFGDQIFPLRTLGAGDCLGEMALIAVMPRSASALAIEPTRAVEIANGDIARLFERDPSDFAMLMMNLAREVCRRFYEADERLFALSRGLGALGPPREAEVQLPSEPASD